MKRIIVVALLLAGCVSLKPKQSCVGVEPCAQVPRLHAGIPARLTVQKTLQSLLINGRPVDGADWPASVYARSGNAACSATLVGERVVLMAAHCMDDGGKISFTAQANNYSASCTHHPQYDSNQTADFALCLTDRPVTGVVFEDIGISEDLSVGQTVTLSGYGCINPGGGGGNDGIFRIGDATIQGLPNAVSNDTITKGGAALCFGDSGGSAYVVKGDSSRVIIGINSRGNISTTSYLASVYNGSLFSAWAKSWSKSNSNVKICGIHSGALYCRAGGSAPPDELKFEVLGGGACVKGVIHPTLLDKKDELVSKIQQAIDNL